ncbi:MAG: DUF2974 domain-containing protein [Thioploca sp.]|nr:DUF2974 domain-containing protein [Thioploca sp.]
MKNNRLQHLKKMLEQVGADPKDLATSLKPFLENITQDDAKRETNVEEDVNIATESLELLQQERIQDIDSDRQFALEAIVMRYYRPVVCISNGKIVTDELGSEWQHLGTDNKLKHIIESTFNSIGRIETSLSSVPYLGTGFLVGKDNNDRGILMTNRHVAEIFSTGIGNKNLQFRSGQKVAIDFLKECNQDDASNKLTIEKILMIHPCWDMALLQVMGLDEEREPLTLNVDDPESLLGRKVVTIGYPGNKPEDDRSIQNIQDRIFNYIYNVKRLQPGILRTPMSFASYNRKVPVITHDCTTLGGNSGSAVLLLPKSPNESIEVIGLHFAGEYLRANYAVSTYDLATDSRIVDTGIKFSESVPLSNDYQDCWLSINSERPSNNSSSVPPDSVSKPHSPENKSFELSSGTATWKIPFEVSVTIGTPELISSTSSIPKTSAVPEEGSSAHQLTSPTSSPPKAISREGLFGRQPHQFSIAELTKMFSLPSLAIDEFDWHTALSLAITSELAYQSKENVESIAQKSWGFNSCKFIAVEDTQCFIASFTKNSVLVAFRGTDSLGDWLSNLDFLGTTPTYGVVHKGFYNSFNEVKQPLEKELKRLSPSSVLLTGHSLGGALATIAAAEWKNKYPITGIYTFGQPAVGKGEFLTFFSYYSNKFFRFVNGNDIVTTVPPTYQHIGKLFHLNARNGAKRR